MRALLENAYRGKRVLLTGHTGFKGSWLLVLLRQLGAVVRGYALAPELPDALYHRIGGDAFCESTLGDVRDAATLRQVMLDFQPDFVFHLAAQALVRRSYREPAPTFDTNVMGTVQLLEAVRALDKPCAVVVVTTDKVYENAERGIPFTETDPLGGYDPYSASKAAAELVVQSYQRSFFHPDHYTTHHKALASARAGNVIGGGDVAADRILPDLVRAIAKGERLVVRNPNAVRPWQHVLEPLCGYLLLGARLAQDPQTFVQAYNFGPNPHDNLAVQQVVQQALAAYGLPTDHYSTPPQHDAPHEAGLLLLNTSKAQELLGWQPRYSAAQAIALTMQWYKHAGNDALQWCEKQASDYLGA